jgi:hypothetical protein
MGIYLGLAPPLMAGGQYDTRASWGQMEPRPFDLEAVFAVTSGFPVYWGGVCGHWELGASGVEGPLYRPSHHPCGACKAVDIERERRRAAAEGLATFGGKSLADVRAELGLPPLETNR